MVSVGGCSSDLTPSLGTSICCKCGTKKVKKKKKLETSASAVICESELPVFLWLLFFFLVGMGGQGG